MVNEKRLIEVLEVLFCSATALDIAGYLIDNDVEPVIRCKDCENSDIYKYGRYCECYGHYVEDDFFCANGERKDK